MKVNYFGIITAVVCVALTMICGSCEDKQAREKIAQLEKDKAQLEVQKAKLGKANKEAEQVKPNFDGVGMVAETRREASSLSNRYSANTQTTPQPSTPQWEKYGNVELWTYTEVDPLFHSKGYQLKCTGEGTVYVCHTEYGDNYELRYVNNGRHYSYHVSRGNFTVETDDGIMQFNAHAGAHYFDM